MKHQEGFLKGVDDSDIYYQYWLPESEPKAILLIVHGLAEHSGRYMNVVNQLVPAGYAVFGLDHIGHGKSAGVRVFVERFEDFTKTLKIYFDKIRELNPTEPIFLVGHSMGGLISAAYLLDHQGDFSGAVLSGPGVKVPENISPVLITIGNILSNILPKVGLIQLDATGVSKDQTVVDAYINDPLVYTGKTTARLGAELLKTMHVVTERAKEIKLPLLIVQGSDDILVDPSGARMLNDLVSSEDKTLKVYEGLYHEVYNEPEHEQVLNDVKMWLDARIGSK